MRKNLKNIKVYASTSTTTPVQVPFCSTIQEKLEKEIQNFTK